MKALRRLFNVRSCLAAAVVTLGFSAQSFAQPVAYGIWNNATGGTQNLVRFNVNTPQVFTNLGSTGLPSTGGPFINSLEFDGSGNLFMATNATAGYFFSVNQNNGLATPIGGAGLAVGDSLGDLSYDHFAGRMLAVGTPGTAGGGARLYQINTATGAATNLGSIGNFTEGFTVSLAVRPSDGRIFAHGIETDRWYSIDPGTLQATQLGALGVDTNFGQGGSFGPDGVLYHAMLSITGGNLSRLASINTTTGAPTFIGNLGATLSQVGDIAFVIPEPSSFMLVGAGVLAGLVRRRR